MGRRKSQSQGLPGPETRSLEIHLVLKLLHLGGRQSTLPATNRLSASFVGRSHEVQRRQGPVSCWRNIAIALIIGEHRRKFAKRMVSSTIQTHFPQLAFRCGLPAVCSLSVTKAHSPLENLPTRKRLSGLSRADLGEGIPSNLDRIVARWECAAQILESLRFIAVHGFDLEGLEL